MLRGVSLAPQQRVVMDPQSLPSELVNSIIGVSAAQHASDYGSFTVSSAAAVLSTAEVAHMGDFTGTAGGDGSPTTTAAAATAGTASASPTWWFSRWFRRAQQQRQIAMPTHVPVFDLDGNLTSSQVGVNTFRFRSLSLFYFIRSQAWTALITYSVLVYLAIVLLISITYYIWGTACGAGMNMVMAVYFTVVSLAANGGYMGEDPETMMDSTHLCYSGRTALVMVCSYVNIVFVGIVAALIVSKAEYTGKLGHRVVFSNFCTLTAIPGRLGQYRLTFRMANVENTTPLAHGQLRLFCVTAEPVREFRLRQKQLQLLKNSIPGKGLGKGQWGSSGQLHAPTSPNGGDAGSGARMPPSMPSLTNTLLEGRRGKTQHTQPRLPRRRPQEALLPLQRSSSGQEKETPLTRDSHTRRGKTERGGDGAAKQVGGPLPLSTSTGEVSALGGAATSNSQSNSRSRQKRRGGGGDGDRRGHDHRGTRPENAGARRARGSRATVAEQKDGTGKESRSASESASSSRSSSSSASSSSSISRSSSSSSSSRATAEAAPAVAPDNTVIGKDSSSTSIAQRPAPQPPQPTRAHPVGKEDSGVTRGAADVASDITNSSMTSKANSELYAASPVVGGEKQKVFLVSANAAKSRTGSQQPAAAAARPVVHDGAAVGEEGEDREMERVRLRMEEMRWTCAEENYLDHGGSGQLSLWYPATVTHVIDERSPLYAFMQQPGVAASLRNGSAALLYSGRSHESNVEPPPPPPIATPAEASRQRFQLVAVFDATDMESGSTITAKHSYTTVDIVAHYKFSDRLVHMQPGSGEVLLDFHYFNALLPVDLVELSTTDSDD